MMEGSAINSSDQQIRTDDGGRRSQRLDMGEAREEFV